jgi:hypothetical protein
METRDGDDAYTRLRLEPCEDLTPCRVEPRSSLPSAFFRQSRALRISLLLDAAVPHRIGMRELGADEHDLR